MSGWLGTPRYDYASVHAAAVAYGEARRRVGRALTSLMPLPALQCPTFAILLSHTNEPEWHRFIRGAAPLYTAAALAVLVLVTAHVAVIAHVWTMREPALGADAAGCYATTRANLVREGRFMLTAAAIGGAVLAAGTAAATWLVRDLAGTPLTWDVPAAVALPAVGGLGVVTVTALRRVRRPDEVLTAAPGRAPTGWRARSYLMYVAGAGAIAVGSLTALLGDAVPGVRQVGHGGADAVVEYHLVATRVPALPFAAGALTLAGWILVATAVRTWRTRCAVLAAGAVTVVWVAALTEPVTGRSPEWLGYGVAPAVLAVLGLLAGLRAVRQRSVR